MATHSDLRSTVPQSVRRRFLQRVSRTSAILAAAMLLGGVPLLADDQPQPAWEMIKTVSLDGLALEAATGGPQSEIPLVPHDDAALGW